MIIIIEKIFYFIGVIIVKITGFILSVFFIFIPTLLLNPNEQIQYIEKDLCLEFPVKYSVLDKYEDWLAFEEHQEITFQFNDDLLTQINTKDCKNGKWEISDNNYSFSINNEFENKDKYFFDASLSIEKKTLKYIFSSY